MNTVMHHIALKYDLISIILVTLLLFSLRSWVACDDTMKASQYLDLQHLHLAHHNGVTSLRCCRCALHD